MTKPADRSGSPDLTSDRFDAIAASLSDDLLVPYLPPARPFTVGTRESWGIRADYRARETVIESAALTPLGVRLVAERISEALHAPRIIDIASLVRDAPATSMVPLDPAALRDSVLLCADLLQRLKTPTGLLEYLAQALEDATLAVISMPLRALTREADDLGPPLRHDYARLWTFPELQAGLDAFGLAPLFGGILGVPSVGADPAPHQLDTGVIIVTRRSETARYQRDR